METERKGQRRARYIVPLLKKRPRQKQIPRCVRDDSKKRKTKRVSLISTYCVTISRNQTDPLLQEQRQKKEGGLPCGFAQGQKSRPYTGKAQVKKRREKQIPHSVRDDKKKERGKADSSRKSAMAQRCESAKKRAGSG